ncbi:MAG: exopolyphosphatase / guanosine-5'-triphosphate 3'-diphosphate [Planctomycetota bacterium]|nr:MAG: exopolyphosphatase / guanosine-5'-triphosphate 3'-diphosphate [Planctomycetota bacterium]
MILAAIDIGSNTVKLLVAKVEGRNLSPLKEEIAYTRLGEGIGEGKPLSTDAMVRTIDAALKFAATAREAGASQTVVTATEAARNATNAAEFLLACRSRGLDVRVLSGEEEARLSWLGGTLNLPAGPSVVLDVGGGSAEITAGDGEIVTWSTRLPLGAVRLRERFLPGAGPARAGSWTLLEDHVLAALASVPPDLPGTLIGVGGTVATLAKLAHPADPFQPLAADRIASMSALLRTLSPPQILGLGVPWGREDIISAGAAVVHLAVRHLRRDRLVPVATGLRFGLLRQLAD